MLQTLKNIFGLGPKTDYQSLVRNGAQIIDVRTRNEFAGGHLKGSVNIPLQELPKKLNQIKKDKPVIVCCASGARSASAKSLLKSKGFPDVYNGGGWTRLQADLR